MALLMRNVVGFSLFLVFGLVLFSTAVESAGSGKAAPAPSGEECSNLVLNMADCLSFVSNGSTVSKPEGTCCDGLKKVLKTDAECLCVAFRNSAQLGVILNVTKAVTLPAACHVSAPSVSTCGLSTGSGIAPALSPSALSHSAAPTPSPSTGSTDVGIAPAQAPGGSSGSSALAGSLGSVALALVALWISLF